MKDGPSTPTPVGGVGQRAMQARECCALLHIGSRRIGGQRAGDKACIIGGNPREVLVSWGLGLCRVCGCGFLMQSLWLVA